MIDKWKCELPEIPCIRYIDYIETTVRIYTNQRRMSSLSSRLASLVCIFHVINICYIFNEKFIFDKKVNGVLSCMKTKTFVHFIVGTVRWNRLRIRDIDVDPRRIFRCVLHIFLLMNIVVIIKLLRHRARWSYWGMHEYYAAAQMLKRECNVEASECNCR